MEKENIQTSGTAKLPILKQDEYEMWRLMIEQYFQIQDYALWDVIENGNSFEPVAQTVKGSSTPHIPGPVTADEKIQKKNDVKARSMLLMALPNEHLMTFNQYKDAKSLFDAKTTRFGGNDVTKKTQKTLLKQMYENFSAQSTENKSDLDKISIDDLYNNFKIVEQEVKRNAGPSSSFGSQNMAFVSTSSTSNNDDVSTVFGTGKKITINRSDTAGYDKAKVECFNCHKMGHFARECRVPRNQENRTINQETTRRKINVEDTSSKVMVAIDGAGFDWSYMADDEAPINMAFMAFLDSEESKGEDEVESPPKIERKTVEPSVNKVEVEIPKQNDKPARRPVKYAEMYITQRPRGLLTLSQPEGPFKEEQRTITNSQKVNNANGKVNIARPNLAILNAVKENKGKAVKASGCWVWRPIKLDSASIVLKKHTYIDARGRSNVARTPQQNRVPERRNKTLIEAARTMLADSKLPTTFLAKAVNTACYVQNRVLVVKPHFKTPYELFRDHLGKFDGKSSKGFFVGYSTNSKAFRVYNTRTKKVEENLHINFLENKPIIAGKRASFNAGQSSMETRPSLDYILMPLWNDGLLFNSSLKDSDGDNKDNDGPCKESEIDNQERRNAENSTKDVNTARPSINTASSNINTASLTVNTFRQSDDFFGGDNDMRSSDEIEVDIRFISAIYEEKTPKDLQTYLFACFLSQEESKRITNALKDPAWVEAMQEEILQFRLQKVWTLVNLPRGVYSRRRWMLRVLFLNERIKEEVYVCQPSSFEVPDYHDKVYKVEKALYDLRQAPRAWYETLAKYLLDNGFHRGKIDQTLFIKRQKEDILLVHVYVDDIIFGSTKK
nr:hypothetical protein [Tanacetum cinerariifolium]